MSDDPRHHDPNAPSLGGAGGEELDALLRQWHKQNADRAAAGRETLMARLRAESHPALKLDLPPLIDVEMEASLRARQTPAERPGAVVVVLRRLSMYRVWTAAAAAIILAATLPLILINHGGGGLPSPTAAGSGGSVELRKASFEGYIMCPEGGRLDARDHDGDLLGPCELRHTDVKADVSGFLTRVTVTQKYHNPHTDKIEAVYTFPLSERSAVDRMTMTVGSRVIEGQVKEKVEARRIYEQAKAEGRIASLLEQERPNIFTQSIANIEPGADIDITISYVETTKQVGGVYEFDFPTTITPRFVPGNPVTGDQLPPPRPNVVRRRGLVLLAPATISEMRPGDTQSRGTLAESQVSAMLQRATPIHATAPAGNIWYTFRAAYADGSAEFGTLYTDGTGTVNGRWFCVPENVMPGQQDLRADAGGGAQPGAPFSPDTDRVPDASKITPMPVVPGTRAGHDISISVNIDTGGPVLGMVKSELHDVITNKAGAHATIKLKNDADIPNRDFVLKWRQESRDVEPAVFTSSVPQGNFFCVQLTPPPAMTDDEVAAIAVPREMVFVLDISGSMKGNPIEKAKEVLDKALSTLRPNDTFNIVKFENNLYTLWSNPRRATPENLVEARAFYNQQLGQGGTQMVQAIQAAYRAGGADGRAGAETPPGITPLQLANLPADGRRVIVDTSLDRIGQQDSSGKGEYRDTLRVSDEVAIDLRLGLRITRDRGWSSQSACRLTGTWSTVDGKRVFLVENVAIDPNPAAAHADPYRVIVFITDGQIANENEVLAEVQEHQGRAAIFPIAVSNSPNRYLLDSMARLGRGEVEYVYDNTNADEIIARFAQRLQTPVLTNIKVEFSPNLNVLDVMTALGGGGGSVASINAIPDLFDVKPLTIVGRYNQPASGTVTISGMTAAGPYRRVVNLDLPAPRAPEQLKEIEDLRSGLVAADQGVPAAARDVMRHDTVATLWARAKVEAVTGEDLRGILSGNVRPDVKSQIVTLGETFSLVTQYTSFVAVDKLRVTIAGKPRLVHIPIELTEGTDFSGFFGGQKGQAKDDDDMVFFDTFGKALGEYRFARRADGEVDRLYIVTNGDGLRDGAAADDFASGFQTRRTKLSTAEGATSSLDAAAAPVVLRRELALKSPADPAPVDGKSRGLGETAGRPAAPAAPSATPSSTGGPAVTAPALPAENKPEGRRDTYAAKPALQRGSEGLEKEKKYAAPDRQAQGVPGAAAPGGAAPEAAKKQEQTPPPPPPPPPAPATKPAGDVLAEQGRRAPGQARGGEAPPPADRNELGLSKLVEEVAPANMRVVTSGDAAYKATGGDDSPSTFVGYIKQDPSAAAARWQLDGIDPAHAAQTANMLGLYFQITQAPAPAESDKAPTAGADAVKTSHQAAPASPADQPRQRVVLAEHVIIRIAKLAHDGQLEQAASLAGALADALPDATAVIEVKRVLTDAAVTPDERTRVLDEQSAGARQRLDAILREIKIRQRLETDLQPLTVAADATVPAGATMTPDGILLSLLVEDVTDATRDALAKAGLRIEGSDAQTHVFVGIAPVNKLADITVVDGVRRVEATRE